ncbi:MAG TPA: GNAT family N-acetyltransferase [Pyrinomonadaceae bacterium]|nr:GNAT family N-acetyltransferase [Pyrinomonadaceae bacterium]
MLVRQARKGDEAAIATLLLKLVAQHVRYDPQRFADFVTHDGAAAFYLDRIGSDSASILVAESDEKIVGFAYLEFQERNYEELVDRGVWLHDIYVEESFRKRGAGRELMQAAITSAAKLGGSKLLLSTASRNDAGRRFFESFGFRPTMTEMTLDLDRPEPDRG